MLMLIVVKHVRRTKMALGIIVEKTVKEDVGINLTPLNEKGITGLPWTIWKR